MPATARQIPLTEADLAGSGGGTYAELEVPGDYEAVLKDVDDYDFTARGKSKGWLFIYEVETPSGAFVEFKSFASFGQNARFKLVEILEAHDADMSAGLNDVDPNAYIGEVIGVHIDFPRDRETDEPTSKYREIKEHFKLVDEPAEELPLAAIEEPGLEESGAEPLSSEVVAEVPDII